MKNLLLFVLLFIFNSCYAQKGQIKSLNDDDLLTDIVNQFSKKANIEIKKSFFAIYFQEMPVVNSVKNGVLKKDIYNGIIVTVYRFENKMQIYRFANEFDIYVNTNNIYSIFDKNTNLNFLKRIKSKRINLENKSDSNSDYYDPKTWVLNFDKEGNLEKCYPYVCN